MYEFVLIIHPQITGETLKINKLLKTTIIHFVNAPSVVLASYLMQPVANPLKMVSFVYC